MTTTIPEFAGRDFLVTARADQMSGAEFFHALFPKPNVEEQNELRAALAEYKEAIQASYKLPSLGDGIDERERLKANYAKRLAEIADKYQLTECKSDPFLKRSAA